MIVEADMEMYETKNPEVTAKPEKYVFGFDGLVEGLKARMTVDPMMHPKEGSNYETDLSAWSKLVTFNGKETLKAKIDRKDGGHFLIEPGVTRLPKNILEEKNRESRLFGVAMSIASLELVQDTIKEVYPVLGEEADQYLATLNEMKDEILDPGAQEKKTDLKVTDMIPVKARLLLVLTAGLLAACSTGVEANTQTVDTRPTATGTGVPTKTADAATETATAVPSATSTEIPSATPTETQSPEEAAVTTQFSELGVDPSSYTLAEKDGVVTATDKVTGKEIFSGGRFELHYLVHKLNPDTLEKTRLTPVNGKLLQPSREVDAYTSAVFRLKIPETEALVGGLPDGESFSATSLLLYKYADGSYAWGSVFDKEGTSAGSYQQFLEYKTSTGEVIMIPVMPISSDDIISFYVNS